MSREDDDKIQTGRMISDMKTNDETSVLLRKRNPQDKAALKLSKNLVNIKNRSYFKDTVKARNFETFGHQIESNGKWRFWIVEDRPENDNSTSIYIREVLKNG